MYSESFLALKLLPLLIDMMAVESGGHGIDGEDIIEW